MNSGNVWGGSTSDGSTKSVLVILEGLLLIINFDAGVGAFEFGDKRLHDGWGFP